MPFDPAGRASLPPSTWATAGQTIRTEQHNPPFRDIEAMLSSVLVRDGRAGMAGPLPMGGFPVRNMLPGTDPSDAATVSQLLPLGAVIPFAGQSAPSGWLFCYGQEVSRSAYPDLFATIGTRYGEGDGSSTFNVPDCRDVVIVGRGNMGGTAKGLLSKFISTILGSIFGTQEHTLTVDQMPSHQHAAGSLTAASAGQHTHNATGSAIGGPTSSRFVARGDSGASTNTLTDAIQPAGAHTHSISGSTANSGSGDAHPNVQPSIVMNYIIRASYA